MMTAIPTKGDRTKEKIITVSKQLFYAKGYDRILIKDISAESNIAPGNLNYYFPTKESIAIEILDLYIAKIKDFIETNIHDFDHYYSYTVYLALIYYINIFNNKNNLRFFSEIVHRKKSHQVFLQHGLDEIYKALIDTFHLDIDKNEYKYFSYADLGAREEILLNYLDGNFPELDLIGMYRIMHTNSIRLLGIDNKEFRVMFEEAVDRIDQYDFSGIKLLN